MHLLVEQHLIMWTVMGAFIISATVLAHSAASAEDVIWHMLASTRFSFMG